MKLAITGSRSIEACAELLTELESLPITELLHGGAAGVDKLAAAWATGKGIKVTELKPDYATHGAAATHVRNSELVKRADKVLACWDGESKGTASTVKKAQACGKLLRVIYGTHLQQLKQEPGQMTLW